MLAQLEQHAGVLTPSAAKRMQHVLFVLPKGAKPAEIAKIPFAPTLHKVLARRRKKITDLAKSPLSADLPGGAMAAWIVLDTAQAVFEQQTLMRKGVQALLGEHPAEIAVAVYGETEQRRKAAELAAYCAWINGARLPERKKKSDTATLKRIH